jgi:hypothetical protein
MDEMTEEKIQKAAVLVIDEVPETWKYNMGKIIETWKTVPQPAPGYVMPFSTYLYYILNQYGIDRRLLFVDSLFKQLDNFIRCYDGMKQTAKDITKLDYLNFQAELEAYDSIEQCLLRPVLAISPLYRYAVAQDMCLEVLLTEEATAKALTQLRVNPFFYFEYPEHQNLMPATWEEL